MSNGYWDVIQWQKRGDKNFAMRIGSAKPTDEGGFRLFLNALPLPDEKGQVSLVIAPQRERDNRGSGGGGFRSGGGYKPRTGQGSAPRTSDVMDDDSEIPF